MKHVAAATTALAILLSAGCSGGGDGAAAGTTAPSSTQTPAATPLATPEPTPTASPSGQQASDADFAAYVRLKIENTSALSDETILQIPPLACGELKAGGDKSDVFTRLRDTNLYTEVTASHDEVDAFIASMAVAWPAVANYCPENVGDMELKN